MIVCFSGTGNTLMAARSLLYPGEKLVRIAPSAPRSLAVAGGERVVWAFPVYAWGLPPVVRKYMKEVSLGSPDSPHFMVCTCGDDVGLTHLEWRGLVCRRGWRPVGAFSLAMPNTYVSLPGFDVDSPSVAESKLRAAPVRLREIARAIRHSARVDDVVRGSVPWLKSRILRPLFKAFLMSPRFFHTSGACIGCGRCAVSCPMANISLDSLRRPVWGKDCAMCLECYHVCPRHAVAYGAMTRTKGQYPGPSDV